MSEEAILMSTHNIGFYREISKIIPYHQISTISILQGQTHMVKTYLRITLIAISQVLLFPL